MRALSVSPGLIVTDLQMGPDGVAGHLGRSAEEHLAEGAGWVPMRRFGTAEEIAAGVTFLLSERLSYTTGTDIVIDGGVLADYRASDAVAPITIRPSQS